jgi:hypothetical protein
VPVPVFPALLRRTERCGVEAVGFGRAIARGVTRHQNLDWAQNPPPSMRLVSQPSFWVKRRKVPEREEMLRPRRPMTIRRMGISERTPPLDGQGYTVR